MAIYFDYTAQLRNAYLLSVSSSNGIYKSSRSTGAGVFFEKFRAVFNPGHQNNSSAFEYYLYPNWMGANSSFKWEFRERGSTVWVKFSTGLGIAALSSQSFKTGTYETSAIALPMTIKLMAKTSLSTGRVWVSNGSTYMCAIRAIGPIST